MPSIAVWLMLANSSLSTLALLIQTKSSDVLNMRNNVQFNKKARRSYILRAFFLSRAGPTGLEPATSCVTEIHTTQFLQYLYTVYNHFLSEV